MNRLTLESFGDDEHDDLFQALQNMEPCANCGKDGARIPCMNGCNHVFYCSKDCMKYHASSHRLMCHNLRCANFHDSDDSEEEDEWTDYEDSDESDPELPAAPKPAAPKPKKKKKKPAAIDTNTEKRIEEKILQRLKDQEENRIAMAIEQKMKEHQASWRDSEMTNIALQVKKQLADEAAQNETLLVKTLQRNTSLDLETQERLKHKIDTETNKFRASYVEPPPAFPAEPPTTESLPTIEKPAAPVNVAAPDSPTPAPELPPPAPATEQWTNTHADFLKVKALVWNSGLLGLEFTQGPTSNKISSIDISNPSLQHLRVGDYLETVNGVNVTKFSAAEVTHILDISSKPSILRFTAGAEDYAEHQAEYIVKWNNGPLGLTLKDDGSPQEIPIVNRITNPDSTAASARIHEGDILTAINNIDTIALGNTLTMSVLKKVQLPAKLRFRGIGGTSANRTEEKLVQPASLDEAVVDEEKAPSESDEASRPSTYVIHWEQGPLGLTIIPGSDDPNDISGTCPPVIKRVTGKGVSPGLELAQMGDQLVAINAVPTQDIAFHDIVLKLKKAIKPVDLQFQVPVVPEPSISASAPSASEPAESPRPPASMEATNPRAKLVAQKTIEEDEGLFPNSYTLVWEQGQLGLTIDALPTHQGGAYIKRVNYEGAAKCMTDENLGDRLVEIGGSNVAEMDFPAIVAYLKTVQRPTVLRFVPDTLRDVSDPSLNKLDRISSMTAPAISSSGSSSSSCSSIEYEIVWDRDALGLSLHTGDATSDYPYIKRLTGEGCAAKCANVRIGDQLVRLNGKSVLRLAFMDLLRDLQTRPKPLTLRFRQPDAKARPRTSSPMALNREAAASDRYKDLHSPFVGGPKLSSSRNFQRMVHRK